MDRLWLLEGPYEAPGWRTLEADAKAKKVNVLVFDRAEWALVRAESAPGGYDGLTSGVPRDGLYLDPQGRGVYVVGGLEVRTPQEVLATLGAQAEELLRKIGDPDAVLERLGRVF